jgi:hypothetical protein
LGGIFDSDPGLLALTHLYHLYGDNDRSHYLSYIAPGRWPFFPASAWNRARRQGLVTQINLGPAGHTGRGGYLDPYTNLPDGRPMVDRTVQVIAEIVGQTALGASLGDKESEKVSEEKLPDRDFADLTVVG